MSDNAPLAIFLTVTFFDLLSLFLSLLRLFGFPRRP